MTHIRWNDGKLGGNWNLASNWDSGTIPTASDDVSFAIINPNLTIVIPAGYAAVANSVDLRSTTGSTLFIAGGSLTTTGAITMEFVGGNYENSISGNGKLDAGGGITGVGQLIAQAGSLDVTGTIAANITMIVSGNSDLLLESATQTNSAINLFSTETLEIGSSGALTIAVAETVSGGTILLDGGALTDMAGLSLAGSLTGIGNLTVGTGASGLTGTGTLEAGYGTLDVTGTVGAGLNVVVEIGGDLKFEGLTTLSSSITLDGTLEIGAAGAVNITTAETIGNSAVIKLDGGALIDTAGLSLASHTPRSVGGALTGFGTVTTGTTAATEFSGGGTVTASGGTLTFAESVDPTGAATIFNIASGATLAFDGAVGTATINPGVTFEGASASLIDTSVAAGNVHLGTISGFASNDSIALSAYGAKDTYSVSGQTLTIKSANGASSERFTFAAGTAVGSLTMSDSAGVDTITICFMAGTMIRTPNGEVAVETLKRGDLVQTSDGEARPVTWLGKQTVAAAFADPIRNWPIRVKTGALGENTPCRDLLLSPGHALLVEDVLIEAGALVNGTSITRETQVPPTFVYYHVELDDHSLIVAENAPAETFVDNVERMAFDNWTEHEALYPEGKLISEMPLPRAKAVRQVPARLRAMLAARADLIGCGAWPEVA